MRVYTHCPACPLSGERGGWHPPSVSTLQRQVLSLPVRPEAFVSPECLTPSSLISVFTGSGSWPLGTVPYLILHPLSTAPLFTSHPPTQARGGSLFCHTLKFNSCLASVFNLTQIFKYDLVFAPSTRKEGVCRF